MRSTDFAALGGIEVLVTGASGGIGSAIARELVEVGAEPWLHYGTQHESAIRLAEELHLDQARAVQADVTDEAAVAALFAEVGRRARLGGLVVNAGIWEKATVPVREMSLRQWRHTLTTNLESAFLCCREFLRTLPRSEPSQDEPGPAMVLIGSTSGVFGEEGHADYSASKAAMRGLMLTLKNEMVRLHPRGRINLVNPGWVATPMAQDALEDVERVNRVTSTMALRKVATPQDVANTVVYLLSERLSGHVSGEAITVAGGMEGRLLHLP